MTITTADLVGIVVKASALLALAAAADLIGRRFASAAIRHFTWTVSLGALLVLPFASTSLPSWSISVPVPAPIAAAAPAETSGVSTPITQVALTDFESWRDSGKANLTPVRPRHTPFDPVAFAFAIYSAGVVLLLARILIDTVIVGRLAARAATVDDPWWLERAAEGASRLGIRRHVRVLRSDENVMPFTFGTIRPTVILPESAERWSLERRSAVILHELAHVARRDCLAQRFASLACAIYWPHPGVWWAARRLRVEREFACDDRVLSAGTGARDYASHLLEIAHTFRANPAPATALGMARARQLEHRLLAIIDEGRNHAGLPRNGGVAILAATAAILLPIASLHAQIAHERAPVTLSVSHDHESSAISNRAADAAGTKPLAQPTADVGRRVADQGRRTPDDRRPTTDNDQDRDRYTSKDFTGTWEMHPTGRPGMINVDLRTTHSQNGFSLPVSRLEALNNGGSAAIRDGKIMDGTVHFLSRRDAGTFTFDGTCRDERCAGTYSFDPDPAFPARIAKYGVGTPTLSQQFQMAMSDTGTAYLDGLKAAGYAVPDVTTLVRAADHGVTLDYVKGMDALGYKLGTLDPLIRMRDHGVDPDYVKGMAAEGVAKLDAGELVRLRDHGVDPEYVKGMRDLGYSSANVADLVKARDHGVDPDFARGVSSLGYKNVPLDELIRLRDHGVDPEYVRGLSAAGYENLAIDLLVKMRDHGVDPPYARGLASLGYKDLPADSLIRLRDHGVDVEFVRRVRQRGGERPSVDDLIRRRDHGDDGR